MVLRDARGEPRHEEREQDEDNSGPQLPATKLVVFSRQRSTHLIEFTADDRRIAPHAVDPSRRHGDEVVGVTVEAPLGEIAWVHLERRSAGAAFERSAGPGWLVRRQRSLQPTQYDRVAPSVKPERHTDEADGQCAPPYYPPLVAL
jgi:hypothetical protein